MQSTTDRSNGAARWPRRSWTWAFIAAAVAVAIAAVVLPSQPRAAPQVIFNTIDGQAISSERLHGRLTLVNFWATTCSVCMQEMPHVVQMYREFHERASMSLQLRCRTIGPTGCGTTVSEGIAVQGSDRFRRPSQSRVRRHRSDTDELPDRRARKDRA